MAVLTKEALIREHTYLGSTLSVLYKNAQPLTSALIREQTFLEEQVCLRCRQGIEDVDTLLQYAERTAYTDKLSKESKHPLGNSSTVNQPKGSRKKCSKAVLPRNCYFCHLLSFKSPLVNLTRRRGLVVRQPTPFTSWTGHPQGEKGVKRKRV
jgi:hypothetical protein